MTKHTQDSPDGSIYSKVLSKEGLTGLPLFMFATFMMTIIYQGMARQEDAISNNGNSLSEIIRESKEQTQILEDIRYALRSNGGLGFHNPARGTATAE